MVTKEKISTESQSSSSRTKFSELQENHQIQAHLVHGVVCSPENPPCSHIRLVYSAVDSYVLRLSRFVGTCRCHNGNQVLITLTTLYFIYGVDPDGHPHRPCTPSRGLLLALCALRSYHDNLARYQLLLHISLSTRCLAVSQVSALVPVHALAQYLTFFALQEDL
jgi:hypothetical protein